MTEKIVYYLTLCKEVPEEQLEQAIELAGLKEFI